MQKIEQIVNSQEAAKIIDKARSLGLEWDFHTYVLFQRSDIDELRQTVRDKLAQKLGKVSGELVDFDIDLRPSSWQDPYNQIAEHQKKLHTCLNYSNKTGTEIVEEGFSYAFARAADVMDSWGTKPPFIKLENLKASYPPLDTNYKVAIERPLLVGGEPTETITKVNEHVPKLRELLI